MDFAKVEQKLNHMILPSHEELEETKLLKESLRFQLQQCCQKL